MKRRDLLIIAFTLAAAAAVYFAMRTGNVQKVRIFSDGELWGEYSLNESCIVDINGRNTLVIENGAAYMRDADCPDKLCIRQGKIGKNGGTIVCLPNKIVVETSGGSADAVSR